MALSIGPALRLDEGEGLELARGQSGALAAFRTALDPVMAATVGDRTTARLMATATSRRQH
jgi:hypothetical protein